MSFIRNVQNVGLGRGIYKATIDSLIELKTIKAGYGIDVVEYDAYLELNLNGAIGTSGFSGHSGETGYSGFSGFSGYSGKSGYSGFSGISGYSGKPGPNGLPGSAGTSGYSGYSGYSGQAGTSGYSGWSGKSGFSGGSGYSGYSGPTGAVGAVGLSGYSGYSGYASGYIFTQGTPSATWSIAHALGKFPGVSMVNTINELIEGDVTYTDSNNIIVQFSTAIDGKAYLT